MIKAREFIRFLVTEVVEFIIWRQFFIFISNTDFLNKIQRWLNIKNSYWYAWIELNVHYVRQVDNSVLYMYTHSYCDKLTTLCFTLILNVTSWQPSALHSYIMLKFDNSLLYTHSHCDELTTLCYTRIHIVASWQPSAIHSLILWPVDQSRCVYL